ncbi:MAG TPA: emp24/gp25L/p24 family protein [Candidatus Thermoplasmatota archaeon]|nr:emp24/gp25L/p24 family protein [Candidatus Thermoplasmatota archaeon]
MRPVLLALALVLLAPTALAAVKADALTLAPGTSETVTVSLGKGQKVAWSYLVKEPRYYEVFLTIQTAGPNATTIFPPARENARDGTFEAPVTGAYRFTFENPNTRTIELEYRVEHAAPGELPGPGFAGVLAVLALGALLFTFGRRE